MYFERITDAQHPLYGTAVEQYQKSFPLHEQREASSQKNILRKPDYLRCWATTQRASRWTHTPMLPRTHS